MRIVFFLSAYLYLCNVGFGQDYKEQFDQLIDSGDTTKQRELLIQWEHEDPKNAELFTSYFNYYFFLARKEFISITTDEPESEGLQIIDSLGGVVGYMGDDVMFDRSITMKGIEKINQGIGLYPNRLDMRFGKIYALGQMEDWELFTNEIVEAVRHSKVNNNAWTWTYNQAKEDGEEFFLGSIQSYQLDLYETEDDALLINMRTIATEMLKVYPEHVESLSNIAITHLLTGEYSLGIEALLNAEKINPTDAVVIGNIAHGYFLNGDIKNSIVYYEKMEKLDDEDAAQFAKQKVKELKKL